ncbi:hypothetical protein ACJX0J_008824, partial [Zea mays]
EKDHVDEDATALHDIQKREINFLFFVKKFITVIEICDLCMIDSFMIGHAKKPALSSCLSKLLTTRVDSFLVCIIINLSLTHNNTADTVRGVEGALIYRLTSLGLHPMGHMDWIVGTC